MCCVSSSAEIVCGGLENVFFFFSVKKAGSNSNADMDVMTVFFFFAFFEMSNVIIVGKDPGRKKNEKRRMIASFFSRN